MRLSNALVIFAACAFILDATAVLADGSGRFPGKGSVEAYNRSCRLGNKASELARRGDYKGAERLDRQAIAVYPYDSASFHNLGNDLEKLGMLDEAILQQQKAIDIEPNMLAAWLAMGTEFELKRNLKEAERCYRKAVQIAPNEYGSLASLGEILRQQCKFTEAMPYLLKAKASPGCKKVPPDEIQEIIDACKRKDCSN
ncbi:MAG: tetratricopeptide repeat protein [Candidatus Obscuribacterales bacterium]|nr:tetratricopeptide repeat protein [Candidatus Obscuribacterales bacterium]